MFTRLPKAARPNMRAATIDQILHDGQPRRSALRRLVARAQERTAWTDQLRALLPADEAGHYMVANIRAERLVIHAENASWATRLHFRAPELLRGLQSLKDFAQVRDIQVRVAARPW